MRCATRSIRRWPRRSSEAAHQAALACGSVSSLRMASSAAVSAANCRDVRASAGIAGLGLQLVHAGHDVDQGVVRALGDVLEGHHLPDGLGLVELPGEDGLDRDFGAGVVFDQIVEVRGQTGGGAAARPPAGPSSSSSA